MNIRIDYYTGTGGTQRVARQIAENLKTDGHDVSLTRIVRDKFVPMGAEVDSYVLLFAVHSFTAPRPVSEWVERLNGCGKSCAVISVSGGGNVVSNTACRRKITKLLEKQNFSVIYDEMVRMPNNWVSVPDEEKCAEILRNVPAKTQQIAQAIGAKKHKRKFVYWIDIPISILGELEHKWVVQFGQGIKTLDSCNGCGICERNCSSSNITIVDGKAVFGDRCDMCLGCIYGCPHKALVATKSGFQVDKKGYDLRKMEKKAQL